MATSQFFITVLVVALFLVIGRQIVRWARRRIKKPAVYDPKRDHPSTWRESIKNRS
jgi:hypothetical protein